MGMPGIAGGPIFISTRPRLTSHRGKLLSGAAGRGTPVYAAIFIRQRRIVIDTALLSDRRMFKLILAHEFFHFVWLRLGNTARWEFEALLKDELRQHARGELGESSCVKKAHAQAGPRCWTDYVCESFCDTGAWLYSGIATHPTFSLAARWRNKRAQWFRSRFERYTKV